MHILGISWLNGIQYVGAESTALAAFLSWEQKDFHDLINCAKLSVDLFT
jgi:hypothetical protein